ncbi:hypothetical protein ACMFWY_10300 [Roseiconus sp. JC912]|uniref:hypothetical protein n=1 Tax=Roseiconus sp. JC912 TaxID=3396307 RepID=UPI003A4C6BB8
MVNFQFYRKTLATNQPLEEVELRQLEPNERFFYAQLASKRGFHLPQWFQRLVSEESSPGFSHSESAGHIIRSSRQCPPATRDSPQRPQPTQIVFQKRAA